MHAWCYFKTLTLKYETDMCNLLYLYATGFQFSF